MRSNNTDCQSFSDMACRHTRQLPRRLPCDCISIPGLHCTILLSFLADMEPQQLWLAHMIAVVEALCYCRKQLDSMTFASTPGRRVPLAAIRYYCLSDHFLECKCTSDLGETSLIAKAC